MCTAFKCANGSMWFATLLIRISLASACPPILARLGTSARRRAAIEFPFVWLFTSSSKAQWQQKVMCKLQILAWTNCDIMFLIVYLQFSYRLLWLLLFVDIFLLLTHKVPYLKAPIITATGCFFNKGTIQTVGTFICFPLNPYLKISQHNVPRAAQIKITDEFSEETWQRLWFSLKATQSCLVLRFWWCARLELITRRLPVRIYKHTSLLDLSRGG